MPDDYPDTPNLAVNHQIPDHKQTVVDRIKNTEPGDPIYDSWSEKIRLRWDEPAPTVKAGKRANFHFAHPARDTGLTVRERARLQSFPDAHVFVGSVTEQRKQVGNAVPPEVMRHLADQVQSFRGDSQHV